MKKPSSCVSSKSKAETAGMGVMWSVKSDVGMPRTGGNGFHEPSPPAHVPARR